MENEEMNVEKKFCIKCGAELADDQMFCAKCGHKVGEAVTPEASGKSAPAKKPPVWIGIVIAALVLVLAGVAVFFIIRGKQANSVTLNTEELTIKAGES